MFAAGDTYKHPQVLDIRVWFRVPGLGLGLRV